MFQVGVKKDDSEVLWIMCFVLVVGMIQQMKMQFWNQTQIPGITFTY